MFFFHKLEFEFQIDIAFDHRIMRFPRDFDHLGRGLPV